MTSVDFETVDEFLEHFGTRGMRWGVRKERSVSNDVKTKPKKMRISPEFREFDKNRRFGRAASLGVGLAGHALGLAPPVAIGLAAASGLAFIARGIVKYRQMKYKDVKTFKASKISKGSSKANEILKSSGKSRISHDGGV